MPSSSNFDLSCCNVTKAVSETFRSIACWQVTLQLVKFKELDVCGSLVLSNSVTFYNLIEQSSYNFIRAYLGHNGEQLGIIGAQ